MNPFDVAKAAGYTPEKILSYFAKAIPGFDGKMSQAMASGYSVDQVLNFLQKQFSGAKVDRRVQRQLQPVFQGEASFGNRGTLPEKKELNTEIGALAGGATGAVVGGLAGGIPGAISGASAGSSAMSDLLKKYEAHKREGGSLSMGDFIKAAIKGGAAGVAALKAPEVLAALQASGSKEELPKEEQGVNVQAQSTTALQPESPVELQGMGPEDSFKIMEVEGKGQVLKNLAPQLSPEDMIGVLKKQMGPRAFKALGDKHGTPTEELVTQAWEFVRASGQPAPGQQQGTPLPSSPPTEESIEADTLQEMAGGPGGQSAIRESVEESVSRSVNRDVKQIDTAVKPEEMQSGKTLQPAEEQTPYSKALWEKEDVKPIYKGSGHPELQKYIASIGQIDTEGKAKPVSAKEIKGIQSSNVRYADYDKDTKKLQVLFYPSGKNKTHGDIYEYEDVPFDDVEKMMAGSGNAKTSGANSFRAWFIGKNPSVGHAFDKFIKKKNDQGDPVYPVKKISEQYVNDEELLKVRGADTVHKAIQYIDAFEDLTLKAQAGQRGEGMKQMDASLKELPEGLLEKFIFAVTKEMSGEIKEAEKKGKSKRYKGGRENVIKQRVADKVDEARKRKPGDG